MSESITIPAHIENGALLLDAPLPKGAVSVEVRVEVSDSGATRPGTRSAKEIDDEIREMSADRDEFWVLTERYLLGKVVDVGGKSSANLHLQLADGRIVTVDATQEQIAAERENRVDHEALLRVEVEEHIGTGQFRNARLIHFAPYRPRFDSDAFDEMVRKGTQAWKGVENPSAWVREERGH